MGLKLLTLAVLTFGFVGKSQGQLRCYACSFSSSDTDQSCLTITDSTLTVPCPSTYCTILRQEFLDPAGQIASFMRGCEESPDFLNHEVTDFNFRTFYRACTSNLCNVGDGIQSVVGGSLSPTPVRDGLNLLVPGTSAAGVVNINALVTLLAVSIVYCLV